MAEYTWSGSNGAALPAGFSGINGENASVLDGTGNVKRPSGGAHTGRLTTSSENYSRMVIKAHGAGNLNKKKLSLQATDARRGYELEIATNTRAIVRKNASYMGDFTIPGGYNFETTDYEVTFIGTDNGSTFSFQAFIGETELTANEDPTDSSAILTGGNPGWYVEWIGETDGLMGAWADTPAGAVVPEISGITPSTVTPSSNLTITGTNFEATQGTGVVTISPADDVDDADAEVQTITAWGDTEITLDGVTFPTGTAHNDTLYLFVTNDSDETNASGEALTASVAPTLSNDGIVDATTDGFKLTWDTDTDSGTSAWALFATAEHRNAWTVSGLPGELTEPANSVDWGTQAVTALGTQETALITGLGEGQTLYYRIYHYGDVTANGS